MDSAITHLEEKCLSLRKEALEIGQEMGLYQTQTLRVVLNEKGRGVVAKHFIPKGSVVCHYEGELVSAAEGRRRSKATDTCYLFFFQLKDRRYCLDATEETNTMGRLLNHSRKHPNVKPVGLVLDGKPTIVFYAIEDVLPSVELLYDYGESDRGLIAQDQWLKL